MGMNRYEVIGYIGRDPEIKTTESGVKIARVVVATSEKYKEAKSGEIVENTEWHNCVAFSKLAEVIEKHLSKGDKIGFFGKHTTRKWQDKDGNERYSSEMKINTMEFMGGSTTSSSAPMPDAPSDDLPF